MGFGDKCCVGGCDNDRRYPEKWVIQSHVGRFSFHKPKNQMIEAWLRQVQKGRKDFAIGKSRESVVICSNHFHDGKPTKVYPLPTLFLTPFEHCNTKSPRKRRPLEYNKVTTTSTTSKSTVYTGPSDFKSDDNGNNPAGDRMEIKVNSIEFALCSASSHITRDGDVHLYIGMQNTDAFNIKIVRIHCPHKSTSKVGVGFVHSVFCDILIVKLLLRQNKGKYLSEVYFWPSR